MLRRHFTISSSALVRSSGARCFTPLLVGIQPSFSSSSVRFVNSNNNAQQTKMNDRFSTKNTNNENTDNKNGDTEPHYDYSRYEKEHAEKSKPRMSFQKQLAYGLCLGVTVLLGTVVITEYFTGEDEGTHLHIPDDERTPRQKAQDQGREELYGRGMLSDCTGLGPDFLPLHVARKFLASDFPDLVLAENREHYERLLFLYVRHVPQFLSFVKNQSVKSATYTDDGGMRTAVLREYLGLDEKTGYFNPEKKENTSNPDRAKRAYQLLSNIVPFALNPETNQIEPVIEKETGAAIGEIRIPVQGEYQQKYLRELQTWESFLKQNPSWRLSSLSIPVLEKLQNMPSTFFQRAIDLTVPDELKKTLKIRCHDESNPSELKNQHGTPCVFNPVLSLAHYGTIKYPTDEKRRNIQAPVSCWCFDAWDIVRQDLSTPALTTLLFNPGNLSSVRLVEELYGVQDAEKKLVWNSKFNDETDNTSLIPQLEKYNCGLVPSFRLTKYFIEETKKGKSSFEWDEKARSVESAELAQPFNPKQEAHAMLILGERKDRQGRTFYLMQNWWQRSQFLEIEREYLIKHVQQNERFKNGDKHFVCFLPEKTFYGKAQNPYITMQISRQVTRQALSEIADAELKEKF